MASAKETSVKEFIIDRTAEKFEQMDTYLKVSSVLVYVVVWVIIYVIA